MRVLLTRLLVFFLAACPLCCSTARAQSKRPSKAGPPSATSIIPFRLTEWNNIIVPATINETVKVDLMFHTAVDSVSITKASADNHPSLKFDQAISVQSWGGQGESKASTGNKLQIGDQIEEGVTLYQGLLSGHESDGKFGPPQLGSEVFEVDFKNRQLVLYSDPPAKIKKWIGLDLAIQNGMMFLRCELANRKGVATEHQLMIHSGYSGGVLLDDSFAAKNDWIGELEVLEETELKDSMGNVLKTQKSVLPGLGVGTLKFKEVEVSFFTGAIQRQKFSLLGGAILKQMNWVFDLRSKRVYVQPTGMAVIGTSSR
ncbi:MAG: hypothetical protein AB8B50_19200 [Pirellulaceae bacterium]